MFELLKKIFFDQIDSKLELWHKSESLNRQAKVINIFPNKPTANTSHTVKTVTAKE